MAQPDNNVSEVDFYQGAGVNIFVSYNDGTAIDGSLVDNTLVMYHPNAPAGVWNLAFIDGFDHNVYLTGTKTGLLSASSTARVTPSGTRQTSEVDCFAVEAVAALLGGIIGDIAGIEIGADIGAAVGILFGPETALISGIGGGVLGSRYGSLVGGTVSLVIAHYLCTAITSKNPPTPAPVPPGGGDPGPPSGGGPGGVVPPANDPGQNCWTDPAPPNCLRQQAPQPG